MSVIEAAYGPITRLVAVRHWPKGVIPGSIEILGELEGGAQVRLVWHYLPFAPEYSESLQVLSARRRMRVELPAPAHADLRSTVSLREKKSGVVQEVSTTAPKGAVELMWEAFHAFVEKGKQPVSGAAEARAQVELMREVLASIVEADGRSLEADEEDETAEAGTEPVMEVEVDLAQDAEPAAAEPASAEPAADADAPAADADAPAADAPADTPSTDTPAADAPTADAPQGDAAPEDPRA